MTDISAIEAKESVEDFPRVSWLLCTHQEDELLHRAIQSCLSQTMRDFELLLVVNGSQAEQLAPKLAQLYAHETRVRVFKTPVHLLNFSLSWGVHLARANFVARMDADDVAYPERLEKQLAYMHQHKDVVVLGTSYRLTDEKGHDHGQVNLPVTNDGIRQAMRFRNPFCHPSVMFRRDPVLKSGGYLGGKHAEDYDLWTRLARNDSWKFANLPSPLLAYNVIPNGMARRSKEAYANVASTQLREFLVTWDVRWLLGACLFVAKAFFRATKD